MRLELDSLDLLSKPDTAHGIAALIEALARIDSVYLMRTPGIPLLYSSGVTYAKVDSWQDIPALLRTRRGDCKSLVAWRLAELRGQGEMALVHVTHTGNHEFHVQVQRPDGLEDPSRRLGMT